MESAEQFIQPGEMDGEIDVERLAFQPVVPVVEARGGDPVAEPVEILEWRPPSIETEEQSFIDRYHLSFLTIRHQLYF